MAVKRRNKVEIEYEDAPSGFVTFYNYKEPLMKYERGFGYVGALVFDGTTEKVQCHLCGEWFGSLSAHIYTAHGMRASEYKETVGLLQTTALLSESARDKLVEKGLGKRMQNLRPGGKHSKETREKIRKTLTENALKSEYHNLKGTCPAQLIDRMQRIFKENGNRRLSRDFNGFEQLLRATFGSVKNACLEAGLPYNAPCINHYKGKRFTEEKILEYITSYIQEHKVAPTRKDFIKNGLYTMYNGGIKNNDNLDKMVKMVYENMEEYIKTKDRVRHTKEKLKDYLVRFRDIHGRMPSYSDSKRGLLPQLSKYSYHFGSWKNALSVAFPEK